MKYSNLDLHGRMSAINCWKLSYEPSQRFFKKRLSHGRRKNMSKHHNINFHSTLRTTCAKLTGHRQSHQMHIPLIR